MRMEEWQCKANHDPRSFQFLLSWRMVGSHFRSRKIRGILWFQNNCALKNAFNFVVFSILWFLHRVSFYSVQNICVFRISFFTVFGGGGLPFLLGGSINLVGREQWLGSLNRPGEPDFIRRRQSVNNRHTRPRKATELTLTQPTTMCIEVEPVST